MTADIILSISLLIVTIYSAVSQYISSRERKDLIRAVLSKNIQDLNTADAIDKMPKAEPEKQPDLVPVQEADDDLFAKMIKAQNTPKN